MKDDNEGSRYPSWKWLAGFLVAILLTVSGYSFGTAISDVKANVLLLQEKKLDKEVYYVDMKDIKEKINAIYRWHMPKELRDKE